MRLYLDSSALVKRYIYEAGSDKVAERCAEASEVVLSVVTVPEIISALNRLRRENKISFSQYDELKKTLILDMKEALLVNLSGSVIQKSIICTEQHPLRALDSIHIASALAAAADLFISADIRQCEAAEKMGLVVERV